MALRIVFAARAIRDLKEIRTYLIARSPRGADRVRGAIERTIDLASEYPGIGRTTNITDLRAIPTRRFRYLVYYRVNDND